MKRSFSRVIQCRWWQKEPKNCGPSPVCADAAPTTPVAHPSKHFRIVVDDPKTFQKVAPVHFGSGIGWDNGLDYSAATLQILLKVQRPMKGRDRAAFEEVGAVQEVRKISMKGKHRRRINSAT